MYLKERYFSADLLFKEAAAANHSEAMYMLGVMYSKARCGCYDKTEALEWFNKAAILGNKRAQYIILEDDDLNIEQKLRNIDEAQDVLEKATNGDSYAQYCMGNRYSCGQGVLKDAAEAIKWYTKAAEQGSDLAIFRLGCCYKNGEGVEKDVAKALMYIEEAAVKNLSMAQYELALHYKSLASDLHVEASIQALYWFSRAAARVVEARIEMAYAYYYGEFLKQDYSRARIWLESLLGFEIPECVYMLGVLYRDGKGTVKDVSYAITLFEKAAKNDHIESIKALAYCYESGMGVEVDDGIALDFYSRAADLDDIEAKEKVKMLEEKRRKALIEEEPSSIHYETGGNALMEAVRIVEACANLIDEGKEVFKSKAEKLEAIYFLWVLVVKHLEEQHKFTKLEPCIVGLTQNLSMLNYEGCDIAVLVSIWVNDRIPTYSRADISQWSQILDHLSVWVEHNGPTDAIENDMPRFDFDNLGGMTERTERQLIILSWLHALISAHTLENIASSILLFEKCVEEAKQKELPAVQIAAQLSAQINISTRTKIVKKEKSSWSKFATFIRNLISSRTIQSSASSR